jgi:glycosyltransferase involved in cell wall biosynthesis
LELAAGFRGRVIDLMAMGIPVIGTQNALDCIEMENGVNGYISDNDDEMAAMAIALLEDPDRRNRISRECQNFATKKYSLEVTYGKLANIYDEL